MPRAANHALTTQALHPTRPAEICIAGGNAPDFVILHRVGRLIERMVATSLRERTCELSMPSTVPLPTGFMNPYTMFFLAGQDGPSDAIVDVRTKLAVRIAN